MCPTPVILPPVSSALLKIQVYVTGHILYLFIYFFPLSPKSSYIFLTFGRGFRTSRISLGKLCRWKGEETALNSHISVVPGGASAQALSGNRSGCHCRAGPGSGSSLGNIIPFQNRGNKTLLFCFSILLPVFQFSFSSRELILL